MRSNKRRWFAGALMVGLAISTGGVIQAQQPDTMVATGLSYSPRQSSVNYDRVDAKDEGRCTGKYETRSGADGLMIYGPDGQILRRFADTNGDRNVDQWCYFKEGIEVYRDIDSDFNGVADQYRWLGTEGTRWGIDKNEDGKIENWKMISAEEATLEVVEAIKNGDEDRFKRLLLSDSELKALMLGEATQVQLADRLSKSRTGFSEFVRTQKIASKQSKWAHFAADKPGLIPEGTVGSTQDVLAYENVIAIVETDEGSQQLLIGTMVQAGPTWRLTDVPRWVSSGTVAGDSGFFFPSVAVNRLAPSDAPEGGMSQAMQSMLTDLDRIDSALREGTGDVANTHSERAKVIRKLITATQGTDDMGSWIRQFADSVSSAVQTGAYPNGLDRLQELERDLHDIPGGQEFLPYVAFRVITTDNLVQLSDPKANYAVIQDTHMKNLERFADTYPEAPEAAESMIQIGLNHELGSEEKEAETWYRKVAANFSTTESGQKAAGAIARLNLEGKTLNLRGKTLEGKDFQSAGPTIVHYWATWCEPCKADMAELRKIQAKYAKQNLQIVGVNLDTDPKTAAAFLRENANKYQWAHIHEQGGFQSDLAVKLGVLSVPVTILIDGKGVVVKRTAHFSTEMAAALDQMMESAPKNQAQAKPAPNKLKK
jgi:thiol-disulfide isomerase/thioredoxin